MQSNDPSAAVAPQQKRRRRSSAPRTVTPTRTACAVVLVLIVVVTVVSLDVFQSLDTLFTMYLILFPIMLGIFYFTRCVAVLATPPRGARCPPPPTARTDNRSPLSHRASPPAQTRDPDLRA
jgi:hypothetical protein